MFWNEAYLLRALLTLNGAFQIVLFNSFLNQCLTDRVKAEFPLFLKTPGPASGCGARRSPAISQRGEAHSRQAKASAAPDSSS